FDRDEEGMRESYRAMYEAYGRIFSRCGCTWRAVEAATGLIGGDVSHEFMVPAEVGEDHIALCDACSYAANLELAGYRRTEPPEGDGRAMEKVSTPGQRTIEEVSGYLGLEPQRMIKCLMYLVEGRPVAVLVPGDREANEVKLARVLGTDEFRLFNEEDWRNHPRYLQGFMGPVGLDSTEVIADESLRGAGGLACGANEEDHHLIHVEEGRDFRPHRFADVTSARAGDACPRCGEPLRVEAGIEVGQVFQLGLKYSEAMRCYYQDENGMSKPMYMGCYGIGVTRTMAAAVEQNHDDNGIIWPAAIAPYHVVVVPVSTKDRQQMELAEHVYGRLNAAGVEAVLDDRPERAGVKFKDADLIGYPLRITVGTGAVAGRQLETRVRRTGEVLLIPVDEVVQKVVQMLKEL
ncbi:MAG: proline--tRNA ligase, partial [Peptococcaceae bacterium]|nr:proline--tRNA ligase [Peptococcaceae bacterium]